MCEITFTWKQERGGIYNPCRFYWYHNCSYMSRFFTFRLSLGATPLMHLFLWTSPCHASRTRFLLFNYWKVFLTWVTARRCQEELYKPEKLPELVQTAEAFYSWGEAIISFLLVFPASFDRTFVVQCGLQGIQAPLCNKSPVWYSARRNALGSRNWKPGLVIILILRRLTQTSIQIQL